MDINAVLHAVPSVLQAAVAIVGALKIVARYTPFEWDDKVLDFVLKPIDFLIGLFGPKQGS